MSFYRITPFIFGLIIGIIGSYIYYQRPEQYAIMATSLCLLILILRVNYRPTGD